MKLLNYKPFKQKKNRYPEIRLGGHYIEQSTEIPQKIYSGVIEFSLPLIDRGFYAAEGSRILGDAYRFRMEQKRRELYSHFDQLWATLIQHKKRMELYPIKLIDVLESQRLNAEINWKKGLIQIVVYLELENQVYNQIYRVYKTQADFIETASRIHFLAGSSYVKRNP